MKPLPPLLPLLISLLLTLTACHSPTPPATDFPAPPIPLVGGTLTSAQLQQIQFLLTPTQPANHAIWFIYVALNNGPNSYDVSVYFTPDTLSPTLCRGRYAHIGSRERTLRKMYNELLPRQPEKAAIIGPGIPLHSYVQIPGNNQTSAIPNIATLPFPQPAQIADNELLPIVAAARSSYASHGIDPATPILSVRKTNDGFQVDIGFRAGMLSGSGTSLTVLHPGKRYFVASDSDHWVN